MIFSHRVFQYVLLGVIALLLLYSVWSLLRGKVGRRAGVMWTILWLAAGVAVLWPGLTAKLAKALGIGRGADLVFYCAVVAMLIGFWAVYIRLSRLRRDITLLVRHLAIAEGERDAGASPTPPSAAPNPPRPATGLQYPERE